jgi:hypothetical protein
VCMCILHVKHHQGTIPIVVGVSIVDYLYLLLDLPRIKRHPHFLDVFSFGSRFSGKRLLSTIRCY